MKNKLPSIILATTLLVLWQVIAMIIDAHYILPSPIQIVRKIYELREPLFLVHLPETLKITIIGLFISVALGLFLATIMDFFPKVKQALYPLIIASQTIPTTAIAPLFILWFGYSIWSKVLVTILITFFPITISVYDGFKSSKREMEELMFTFGAAKMQIFFKVKVKSALPSFFSAIKMAIPLSIIGAAIGEWLGAQAGLGYFSKRMMTQLDGAGVFAPIVILSIAAMILVWIVDILENKYVKWRNEI